MLLLNRIRWGVLLMTTIVVVSICSYKALTGCDWIDAAYFFVITVSTVGYGETSNQPPEVQLLTIAIILFGVTGVAYVAGLIVQSMFEGQIEKALGVRRMTRQIDELVDHTIICGYGRIGQTIAQELARRGKPFVVVDGDPDIVEAAREDGQLAVIGDATDEETLLDAHIERAHTLVVSLHSDADNVFLTLTARNLNKDLRIIARGEHIATEKKLRQAGADQVVLPAVIGGRRMAALVTRPNAAEMLEHFMNNERADVELEELRIPESSPLVGKTVRDTDARQRYRLLIIGIRRAAGTMVFNPDSHEKFEVDDVLVVMGDKADADKFEKELGLTFEGGG